MAQRRGNSRALPPSGLAVPTPHQQAEQHVDASRVSPAGTFMLTQRELFPIYSAWSEREHRWVTMTFYEHQAWLARPDRDPVEFASSEVAS